LAQWLCVSAPKKNTVENNRGVALKSMTKINKKEKNGALALQSL
jgi:hypothetical protein